MSPLSFETKETVTLRYQLKEDGAARDISGMAFTFAAKERHTDTLYKIPPVNGTIENASEGMFSITLTMPASPFAGLYSIVMEDTGGKRTVLSKPGGTSIRVLESLLD
jgi:hypothetical protein